MKGYNRVILMGNLGQDPEIRQMPNGSTACTLSLATSETWKDKQTGEKQERTDWHRVVAFGKLAEIMGEYLKKGNPVLIEGQLRVRQWEKDGQKRTTVEVLASEMQMLGGRSSSPADSLPERMSPSETPNGGMPDFNDDVPF